MTISAPKKSAILFAAEREVALRPKIIKEEMREDLNKKIRSKLTLEELIEDVVEKYFDNISSLFLLVFLVKLLNLRTFVLIDSF